MCVDNICVSAVQACQHKRGVEKCHCWNEQAGTGWTAFCSSSHASHVWGLIHCISCTRWLAACAIKTHTQCNCCCVLVSFGSRNGDYLLRPRQKKNLKCTSNVTSSLDWLCFLQDDLHLSCMWNKMKENIAPLCIVSNKAWGNGYIGLPWFKASEVNTFKATMRQLLPNLTNRS